MNLAHAAGAGGPHSEYLMVAAGLLVLGVLLFVQKSVAPAVSISLILGALAVGTGAFVVGADEPAALGRRIVITSPKPGDVVAANEPFRIEVAITGAELASSTTAEDGSHIHVYVDGLVLKHTTAVNPRIEVGPGKHSLRIELAGPDHVAYKPAVADEIEVIAKRGG